MSVSANRNSWLYVPLLLDAAGFLDEADAHAWRSHLASAPWWSEAVTTLQAALPIHATDLAAALAQSESLPAHVAVAIARLADVNGDAQVDMALVIGLMADLRGYLHTEVQDILLQMFGGEAFARAIDVQSDQWKSSLH